jgi:AraC-like DNA-binding protein
MYVLRMTVGHRLLITDAPQTRIGRISLAGQVLHAEPLMPRGLRVLDDFVVSFVTAGRGRYTRADGRLLPIVAPALTLVPPGVPHTYGTGPGEPWTEWFVVGNGPIWALLAATGVLPAADGPTQPSPAAGPDELAQVLAAAPRSRSAAERQLWALATWLTSALRQQEGIWSRAEELLASDLERRVELREVAADLDLGYDTFRRRFAERFGRSPLAFRNERRLEVAATWLRLTTMTHREIARRLGYTDEFHFSRRFRARFGTSPSAYRRGSSRP